MPAIAHRVAATNMDGCIVIKDDVSAIRFFEAGGCSICNY